MYPHLPLYPRRPSPHSQDPQGRRNSAEEGQRRTEPGLWAAKREVFGFCQPISHQSEASRSEGAVLSGNLQTTRLAADL